MNARPIPGLALLPFAAACLLAGACSRDVSGPGEALTAPDGLSHAATAASDSSGITISSTGNLSLEFKALKYDPKSSAE